MAKGSGAKANTFQVNPGGMGPPSPYADSGWVKGGGQGRSAFPAAPNGAWDPNGPFTAAYGALQSYNAPMFANLDAQRANYNRQIGYTSQRLGATQQGLQADYDARLAGLNASRTGTNVDLSEAYRQLPLIDQLSELANQFLTSQQTGFGFREQAEQSGAAKQRTALMSDAASRGATFAPGTKTQKSFIQNDLASALGMIGTQRTQANIENTRQQLGFSEDRAKANDQITKLNAISESYGLQADAMSRQLKAGLEAAGLDTAISIGDLMNGLNSANYQSQMLARQILEQSMQYATAFAKTQ